MLPTDDSVSDAGSRSAVQIGFFDSRNSPDLTGMMRVVRLARHLEDTYGTTARIIAHAILFSRPTEAPAGMQVHLVDPRLHANHSLAHCLHARLRGLCHGPGAIYMWKPLAFLLLPVHIEHLLLIDTDIVPIQPLSRLWASAAAFGPRSVIGISREQTSVYLPRGGANGGVALMHLARMRGEPEFTAHLDRIATGTKRYRIGYLGDQTFYTLLEREAPHLFHGLGCEWNRQISMHSGFGNATQHTCPHRCAMLHANYGSLKCIANRMQASNASCATWRALLAGGDINRCPNLTPKLSRRFTAGMALYFSECCIGDTGAAHTGHEEDFVPGRTA
jgi:hypothetical protein